MAALRIEIESFFHRGPNSAPCSVFPAGFALQSELRTAGVLLQVGFNFLQIISLISSFEITFQIVPFMHTVFQVYCPPFLFCTQAASS